MSVSSAVSELVPASLFSLLSNSDNSETKRDGIIYRAVEDNEELSKLEQWAKETSSYFAAFFDAYSDLGVGFGFDTINIWMFLQLHT